MIRRRERLPRTEDGENDRADGGDPVRFIVGRWLHVVVVSSILFAYAATGIERHSHPVSDFVLVLFGKTARERQKRFEVRVLRDC